MKELSVPVQRKAKIHLANSYRLELYIQHLGLVIKLPGLKKAQVVTPFGSAVC